MCDLDEVLRALASDERRHVIDCLQRHHVVALADLAEFVAERESEGRAETISAERVRDVYFSLYHSHIPTLEAVDLAHYEQETDTVARTRNVRPSLRRARDCVNGLLGDS